MTLEARSEAVFKPGHKAPRPKEKEAISMVHCRPQWVLGFSVLIAATAAGGTGAAARSPEDILKSHDLKRVGTTYVLPAESEIQRKTSALKSLSAQLTLSIRRQQYNAREVEDQQGMLRELLQRRVALNDAIAQLDQQLNSMAGPARVNQFVAAHSQRGRPPAQPSRHELQRSDRSNQAPPDQPGSGSEGQESDRGGRLASA